MKKLFLLLLFLLFGPAWAEPIKIIVPFAAGGAADQAARIVEKILTTRTQNTYVIEYRAGAGGSIGANHVAKYRGPETILMIHSLALVVNGLQPNSTYSLADFEPVATLGTVQLALITNSNGRVNTMPKLLATKEPVFFGSSGIGSATHISGEIFGKETGIDMTHVPYKGEASALTDILNNNINLLFSAVNVVKSHPVTVLAVTGTRRSREFPTVPTLQEQGIKGFETSPNWLILVANGTADQKILSSIKSALNVALQEDPEIFSRIGIDTDRKQLYNTQQFLLAEQQRIRRLLEKIKIQ